MAQRGAKSDKGEAERAICGLIMPISAMPPEYDAQHWAEVREIIEEAVEKAGLQSQMVSESPEGDVITQRIISNIFNNPIVVCDVSGLNANVMFELGLRLASKRATIIVTDSYDDLPFDTRIIEHIGYRRDLRIRDTRQFISDLSDRISSDMEQVRSDSYRPFLESFAGVDPQEIKITESSQLDEIQSQLSNLQRQMRQMTSKSRVNDLLSLYSQGEPNTPHSIAYSVQMDGTNVDRLSSDILNLPEVFGVNMEEGGTPPLDLRITVTFTRTPRKTTLDAVDRIVLANTKPISKP